MNLDLVNRKEDEPMIIPENMFQEKDVSRLPTPVDQIQSVLTWIISLYSPEREGFATMSCDKDGGAAKIFFSDEETCLLLRIASSLMKLPPMSMLHCQNQLL